jgi:Tfp pilus assembly protein PilN
MAEPNFIPEWYPIARRQQRLLNLQWSIALALAGLLTAWSFIGHRSAVLASNQLDETRRELNDRYREVRQLEELQRFQNELLSKQHLVSQLGLPIEVGRILKEVGNCQPGAVSLTEYAQEQVEQAVPLTDITRSSSRSKSKPQVERFLEVTLRGIAPDDSAIAEFNARLADQRFFESVQLVSSVEQQRDRRVVRSFSINFRIPLDIGSEE